MHFPVLLAGFVLGGPWGLALGFAAPLLRSVLFGMPPMYPIAIAMAFELATYGAVAGFMYRKVQHTLPMIYATLVTSMVAGRLVWGAVRFVLAGLSGSSFPFSAFLSGAGAHCRARHRGAAHPHSADRGRAAESQADGLTPCADRTHTAKKPGTVPAMAAGGSGLFSSYYSVAAAVTKKEGESSTGKLEKISRQSLH